MTSKETKKKQAQKIENDLNEENFLTLHNDDIHSFDYVIRALVEICKLEYEQAAQCTLITHYKGKCDVKKGGFSELRGMKNALVERELNATIN